MHTLLTLLIVAIAPAAANEGPPGEAVVVFSTGFEDDADLDFDLWPDGWTRRRGPGYPRYVGIEIAQPAAPQPPPPEGRRVLRVELDGGAASMSGKLAPVDPNYSFVLEGWVRAEGLRHDDAMLSLTLHDEHGQPLEEFRSIVLTGTTPWTRLRVGPIHATDERAVQMSIGLRVASRDGQRHDIRGGASFDGLWLGRLPKLSITTGNRLHLFTDPSEVEITCHASGVNGADTAVHFELLDALGQKIDQAEMPLHRDAVGTHPEQTAADSSDTDGTHTDGTHTDGTADAAATSSGGLSGSVSWRPKLTDYGFYRARVTMAGHEQVALVREVTLAVLDPQPPAPRGEFGWTLPDGEGPFGLSALPGLMGQMGVNWVKFPLWHAEQDMARSAALAAFDERLRTRNIELVGLLCNPPEELRARFGHASRLQAADIFLADPDVWYPSLEPVMSGLSMRIHWWQLGSDSDTSFVGDPRTPATVDRVRQKLAMLGPSVRLGLAWGWINQVPDVAQPAWQALALSADPPLTSDELAAYLDASEGSNAQRWVVLDPLPQGEYPPQARADDLVQRILAAKIHGADAMFVPNPLDERRGLFQGDGTPGEMLLPWRTAAVALAGAEYLGSAALPGGSSNHVFSRGRDAVMVVWNETPCQENLYLGDGAVQTDVWGRRRPLATRDGRQTIEVGPSPVFVSGINDPIIRLAMTTRFERAQVPSIFGEAHENALRFRNYFPVGARGKLRLVAPEGWIVQPSQVDFKMAAGEDVELPLELKFSYAASSGPQQVRLEFELTTDATYRFDVVRVIEVGLGDVTLDVSTRLNEQGELVVEQRITNHTDQPVSFKCDLSVPQYRLMRTQVWELARGTDTQTYPLVGGRDVLGQTIWIRAQEIKGPRVLSQRHVARP